MTTTYLQLNPDELQAIMQMALLIEVQQGIALHPAKNYEDLLSVIRLAQSSPNAKLQAVFEQFLTALTPHQINMLTSIGILLIQEHQDNVLPAIQSASDAAA